MTEIVIYHLYNASKDAPIHGEVFVGRPPLADPIFTPYPIPQAVPDPIRITTTAKTKSTQSITLKLSKILALLGVLLIITYFAPTAWYKVKGLWSWGVSSFGLSTPEITHLTSVTEDAKPRALPPFDSGLPLSNHLTIPSIGVNTDIQEATYASYEEALKKGVWRVSNFGEPDESGAPVILAAHRFGYLAWTNTYRHLNSFYNLPKVEVGDVIQIAWNQRLYTYGVYKTEKGTEITDYSADLILYTCESLSGPERIFVYAHLIS